MKIAVAILAINFNLLSIACTNSEKNCYLKDSMQRESR